MNLNSISALQDNYIWVLNNEQGKCIIVDPGEAYPVLKALDENHWQPEAILLTHHHHDHVGGVKELVKKYPGLVVYGPEETQDKGTNRVVREGDTVNILKYEFSVIATPGHTSGHLCFYSAPYLFCGDTMFSGGCGRLFEGTAQDMYQSFQKLNQLPAETLICCAHEYTLSNIKFSLSILPGDDALNRYCRKVKELRAKNHSTLPSSLQNEREINLFLRTDDIDLKEKASREANLQQPQQIFAWLRAKKDAF
ncbi:hydroxyacylglutathione hydrolase [Buttiauxella warmboldiae]|uniref:Hydroxyacylglutathione hydrolase n=1 Tax=Buttiauxella warmboldiae TaxID=82993 RepID=A0A3N5E0T1_9ENTR|nr:hydroxyacylglutathione hydrolase [Buttiauxella warmboldiae]RPH21909.1 hydroxyacylglutathione hydrolase [Buttiauxella warmboldiae]